MADLDGLRKRVEQIDLRLKTAHRAREKESTALMDMWEQIRERLTDQNAEITRLRSRVADLEDTRDDLLGMVHGLLSAVEGGLERMSDETVPKINAMANSLLHENGTGLPQDVSAEKTVSRDRHTSASQIERDAEDTLDAPNFHDDLLSAIERSIENVRIDVAEEAPVEAVKNRTRTTVHDLDTPASPGIRDLVARIENAVGPDFLDTTTEDDDDRPLDDELSRDLREIEALRGELNGLRERIASGR